MAAKRNKEFRRAVELGDPGAAADASAASRSAAIIKYDVRPL